MRSRTTRSHGITHSLTPFLEEHDRQLLEYDVPQPLSKNYSPLYQKDSYFNPHLNRSRKHRLAEEKNTDIERENRRLYEKLRKIKLKNAYQSQEKISMDVIPENNFGTTLKPVSLPQVSRNHSLNSTKSELNNILNNTKTFVHKYFDQLDKIRGKMVKKTEELGNFNCNGWKIKVLLLDDQYIVLRGKKGIKELTKKYIWNKVRAKMTSGLQNWVRIKYQFEE